MEKRESLYIPTGIKEKNEYWEGFGSQELKVAFKIIVFMAGANIFLNIFIRSAIFLVFGILISIVIGLILPTKGNTNLSVVDQVKNMIDFSKSQKDYDYRAMEEW